MNEGEVQGKRSIRELVGEDEGGSLPVCGQLVSDALNIFVSSFFRLFLSFSSTYPAAITTNLFRS
jgi:hypothetical protein